MSALAPTMVLADTLDITAAGDLHKALLAVRGGPLTLDASAVRRIGGQCLQILLAARDAWAADGQPFELREPSAELLDGLALLGADDLATPQITALQD